MCRNFKILIEKNLNISVNYDNKNIIKDLQVSDYKRYKKGLIGLLNRLNEFAYNGKYFENMVLNITGGFKGVIPYLTIYGQVNNIPLFYIFETTDALIQIPQIPISIDENIFEKDWEIFYTIEKEDVIEKSKLKPSFLKNYENLLEIEDDFVSFNPLGKILWDKYNIENFIFYSTNDIFKEIEKQKNICAILKEKFRFNYEDKTEQKNNHFVYDDGNNPNRIFYFSENGHFYIYKTFENHDKYEKYLNSKEMSKEEFMKNATLFKI
jgi:hypothetical protein